MDATAFRREERVGLGVAVVLHLLLFAVFLLQPSRSEVFEIPERMTVSLAEEVGLEATALDPVAESRAAVAPTLSEQPTPMAQPAPTPPDTSVQPDPRPVTQPQPTVRQQPTPRRTSAPAPRNTPAPAPRPTQASGGGSRIGDDFLGGAGNSTTTNETRIPASQIGASAKASIVQQIVREIRPHWSAPSGLDAELLVTELAFDLNPDGSLKGRPRVLRQSGINDSNKPQASLHAERAIAAVIKAAPFDLPPELYNGWKSIRGARFDRNLSR